MLNMLLKWKFAGFYVVSLPRRESKCSIKQCLQGSFLFY